jgi:hypothetical protein
MGEPILLLSHTPLWSGTKVRRGRIFYLYNSVCSGGLVVSSAHGCDIDTTSMNLVNDWENESVHRRMNE